MIRFGFLFALLLACCAAAPVAARNLTLDDMFNERDVTDPQISPDGNWIAYSVEQMNAKDDESYSHIWMTSFDGVAHAPAHGPREGKRIHAALFARRPLYRVPVGSQ